MEHERASNSPFAISARHVTLSVACNTHQEEYAYFYGPTVESVQRQADEWWERHVGAEREGDLLNLVRRLAELHPAAHQSDALLMRRMNMPVSSPEAKRQLQALIDARRVLAGKPVGEPCLICADLPEPKPETIRSTARCSA